LIAVTPSGLGKTPWEEVKKICLDYTVTGVETISQLRRDSAGKPLRFIYTSGAKTQRDPTKKPWVLGDYSLLRVRVSLLFLLLSLISLLRPPGQGEAESYVVDYAKESRGTVEACVVRPGLIVAPGRTGLVMTALQTVGRTIISLPKLDVSEIAAALLDQAIKGFEKDTLLNEDLVRIGRNALAEQQQVS
jgi:hypothetical protein